MHCSLGKCACTLTQAWQVHRRGCTVRGCLLPGREAPGQFFREVTKACEAEMLNALSLPE